MSLPEVLKAIAGLPDHCAMRPRGLMIVMSDRLQIFKVGKNGPHSWTPMYSDIVALDWQAFSKAQLAAMRERQADEAGQG